MWALWDMSMVPTSNVAFTDPPMAESIGPRFSIRVQKSALPIWQFVPVIRSFCLPACGTPGVLRGAAMLRSIGPVAVFTVLRTRAKPGLDSAELGCRKVIGDV